MPRRLCLCGSLLMMLLAAAPAGAAPADGSPAADLAMNETVNKAVGDLASARWATRQAAEERLVALGQSALAAIDPLLAVAADPEVLWRLERVYRRLVPQDAYVAQERRPGFLGVAFEPVSADADRRLGEREWGIRVKTVEPGSAAVEAGLAPGDLIVAIDGRKFIGDITSEHIVERIQQNAEGTLVRLAVYREQELRDVPVTLTAVRAPLVGLPAPNVEDFCWGRYWQRHLEEVRGGARRPPAATPDPGGRQAPPAGGLPGPSTDAAPPAPEE